MSNDKTIIKAVHIVLSYCYKNGISIGNREYLWSRAVMWGRKVFYDNAKSLAAVIICDDYNPVTLEEAEQLQRFYFDAIFE